MQTIRKNSGFTIVELLIVIVVIGILAAIVTVAYNGINTRALNTSRATELKSWQKLFEAYRATNGKLPTLTSGYYCLGTGFPSGSGGGNQPRCRNYNDTSANSYLETTGSALMADLSSAGTIPKSNKVAVNGTIVGPYFQYVAGSGGYISGWFDGNSASGCPSGTTFGYTDGSAILSCYIFISEN